MILFISRLNECKMKYKMTEQLARTEENMIAEFLTLSDMNVFLKMKTIIDKSEEKKCVYRRYVDGELLEQISQEPISLGFAQYAEGNGDVDNINPMPYSVVIKQGDDSEQTSIAHFYHDSNAHLFVLGKCELDHTTTEKDLFLIFKKDYLIDTVNKGIIAQKKKNADAIDPHEFEAKFQPTPLQTRPTPPSVPRDCWENKEENEY